MSNVMTYKNYIAQIEFDSESKMICGSVLGLNDAIFFEVNNASDVEKAFHEAVDDYVKFCEEKGKVPEKSYKGSFNVRITPELHRLAAMAAATKHESLNQFVAEAIAAAV